MVATQQYLRKNKRAQYVKKETLVGYMPNEFKKPPSLT